MPERSLREALTELTGHFLPVTDATYWSDVLGEARATAALVAVNHERAQILAPHRVRRPVGRSRSPEGQAGPDGPEHPWPADDVRRPRNRPAGDAGR